MPRGNPVRSCVRPRFTAGSPAQVGFDVAERVAAQEREHHGFVVEGYEGEDRKALAEDEHALYGIAYELQEKRKHWLYVDLITGEQREISFVQWRIEDALIRERRAPSVARKAADLLVKAMPKLKDGRAFDLHRVWAKSFDAYIEQCFVNADEAMDRSVREAAMGMSR